jgi:pimeloyl-ACP methyl ester carboxylesterase
MSYGPGPAESKFRFPSNSSYGPTVALRSKKSPQGDWDERVRMYSEGLALEEWKPDFPNYQPPLWVSSPDSARKGSFSYPVHAVFGAQDIALNPGICLGSLEAFMLDAEQGMRKPQIESAQGVECQSVGRSSITKLPVCGHWMMLEEQGKEVLDRLLRRLIEKPSSGAA